MFRPTPSSKSSYSNQPRNKRSARTRHNEPALIRRHPFLAALSNQTAEFPIWKHCSGSRSTFAHQTAELPIWKRCSCSRSTFAHQAAEFPIWKHCSGSRSTFAHQTAESPIWKLCPGSMRGQKACALACAYFMTVRPGRAGSEAGAHVGSPLGSFAPSHAGPVQVGRLVPEHATTRTRELVVRIASR